MPFGVIRAPENHHRHLKWNAEAGAIAARDGLAEWRIARDRQYNLCGQPETAEHVFIRCRTPIIFCRRLSRATDLHLPQRFKYDEGTNARAREKLRLPYTPLGRQELWRNSCIVYSFREKHAPTVLMGSSVC
ncbi:hypothetical protein HPB48_016645 [Haemaphysalis longicornis]|uniref:Uncharacterized protein n=1 Tax=Haemaphysalis longicornis TaxID=44386 RepID=A0A9J6F9H2_HAELO|nr:hypothetical protein HPB48_016645 [Haemaphysalis longicornis]